MNKPLWSPTEQQQKNANMWHFMEYVNEQYQLNISAYKTLYNWSINHKQDFWSAVWTFCEIRASREWISILNKTDEFPYYEWFKGSRLNFAENLLRFATSPEHRHKPAIIFWGEETPNKTQLKRTLSYQELYDQVTSLAQAMRSVGVTQGDRVAAFIPNVPEAVVAMLATTSIGAIWSSCSPDFGAQGVLDRFGQIEPKILFCCDGYRFKGKNISSLETVKSLEKNIPNLEHIVVIPYLTYKQDSASIGELDISSLNKGILYNEFRKNKYRYEFEFTQLPFSHPLYIMYSSGTTGKPKCIVHSAGGTLIQHLKELVLHTNLVKDDRIFYFTTCGWMMWNWLVSSLATGATVMLYDGAPMHPYPDFLFHYAEQENITVFGTSAKYLSALEKSGAQPEKIYNLPQLRTILSTGSPLLPESFDYVYKQISPTVQLSSISGGTDIISCFALGNPVLPVYRGELQSIGLGMDVNILNEYGNREENKKGELTCKPPFPSMPLYFWHDPKHKKYREAYFSRFPKIWAHGDYAQTTEHDGIIIYGRSDATLNPGGVRIGTAEIYRQVEKLPEVMESIAVGQEWRGDTRIILFVKLREKLTLNEDLKTKIKSIIKENTSQRHVPAKIIQVPDIPRTISGKIVELAVANVIHNRPVKNKDALANPEALDAFINLTELKEE